jgi:hypothetical protein
MRRIAGVILGTVALMLVLLAAPLSAEAQQAGTVKVGWLLPDPKPFALDPFRERLRELGWIEGANLIIEQRYSQGIAERYPQLAAELQPALRQRRLERDLAARGFEVFAGEKLPPAPQ